MNITRERLQTLYSQSPVPVYEYRMTKWMGRYNRRPWYEGKRPWPHITISTILLPYQKAAVFLHELGHHCCSEKSCVCRTTNDNTLNEAHAMMYGLEKCLDHEFIRSHRWAVETIRQHLSGHNALYKAAAKMVSKDKRWKEHNRV